MKIRFALLLLIILLPLLFVTKTSSASNVAGHKIVIDAGHGGSDPGSEECAGYTEADANFEVAKRLAKELGDNGAIVYMTRDQNIDGVDDLLDGGDYDAADRYNYANSTDAEILVSVHFNGSTNHEINYTQGLYAKWKKDINLASTIHEQLVPKLNIGDGDLLQFAAGVILKAEMPATIQEVAFISNTAECQLLTDGVSNETYARQEQIAAALYDGINEWFAGSVTPTKPGRAK